MASVAMTIEFPLRVILYPAPDLEGQWIAHGLETDVVTQGDSAGHALAMMADALQRLASYEAVRRRPSLRLRPAPREVWDLAANAVPLDLHHGSKTELSDVYVRGLCRALEIDYETLRQRLY